MYESYFSLNERPFKIGPDPRFLYLARQHKEVLAKCQYMIEYRVGPVYVYGPIGTGKTSVARRIVEQLSEDERYNVAFLIGPNLKTSNSFLRTIMAQFGAETTPSYERSLRNFSQFLIDQAEAGKVPVLIVDEAQNLKPDMLRLVHFLLNFETNTEKLLQVVLFGQHELATNISKFPELKSRMFPAALEALTLADMTDMIAFRFQVAGGGDHPFTPEAIHAIFRASLGLPREVCKLCDMALLAAASLGRDRIDEELINDTAAQLQIEAANLVDAAYPKGMPEALQQELDATEKPKAVAA